MIKLFTLFTMQNIKKVIRLNGMFFKVFSSIFYAGTIKPVLTFEYFSSVFSKLKLNYKFLIGLFVLMLATIFHVHVCS